MWPVVGTSEIVLGFNGAEQTLSTVRKYKIHGTSKIHLAWIFVLGSDSEAHLLLE